MIHTALLVVIAIISFIFGVFTGLFAAVMNEYEQRERDDIS